MSFWTNPSVRALSGDADPIETITFKARKVVFDALEHRWKGPPFDPFALAELMGLATAPTTEVIDAKTVPLSGNRFRIEFNPDRPQRRIRYSVFHEIAHTLFPDCAQNIRYRGGHNATRPDAWQLETLCNIAAAEFLLPVGSLGDIEKLEASVDQVLDLRERFQASSEASLLRIVRLTTEPCIAFACHRPQTTSRYMLEYAIASAGTRWRLKPGFLLPTYSGASECTAIGYSAKQTEEWPQIGRAKVEYLGVAPFPKETLPRVIGFIRNSVRVQSEANITYIRGDATRPRGEDAKLLLQVVSDGAFAWGGSGFAAAVRRRWPHAHTRYSATTHRDRQSLTLGNTLSFELEENLTLVTLVAQHGYGPSSRPRIRYGALQTALSRVVELAKNMSASIHMPRIGSGEAGGAWPIVEGIIRETLIRSGLKVTVYDLPHAGSQRKVQGDLVFVG